ncbi:type III secretion HpaP family protein [Paraburkholderia humisilvae]|uniref:Uncharacterized protein n=1 Tax=Paraburkholderia humisilvae TaxID=627669 RepID=A0A6J5F8U6_9BURK|nr:type III secretion HpaP family protein [Paraburkholderia humisilvae]CAB3773596.1 hypothetical protein LMG29542_07336 [Paraburkholderia humisilvae]
MITPSPFHSPVASPQQDAVDAARAPHPDDVSGALAARFARALATKHAAAHVQTRPHWLPAHDAGAHAAPTPYGNDKTDARHNQEPDPAPPRRDVPEANAARVANHASGAPSNANRQSDTLPALLPDTRARTANARVDEAPHADTRTDIAPGTEPLTPDAALSDASGTGDSPRDTRLAPGGATSAPHVRGMTADGMRRGTLLQEVRDADRSLASRVSRRTPSYAAGHSARPRDGETRSPVAPDARRADAVQPRNPHALLHAFDGQIDEALADQNDTLAGSFEIPLQLDPAVLPDTRATLQISPAGLVVRFESRDPGATSLLCLHANDLAERLTRRTSRPTRVEIAD